MKFIHPSIEILEQGPGIQGIYDMVELCGKTSYKSEVKGGKTAEDFVSARVNEEHYAVLEFGTVYLTVPAKDRYWIGYWDLVGNPYVRLSFELDDTNYYITTNLRVIVEKGAHKLLDYATSPTKHLKRYTVRIITDRGVSHELVRHRAFSFCQESTRYCNYSKDKFGNELTFIMPSWFYASEENTKVPFVNSLTQAEKTYLELINTYCWTPQQARQVLPNALKTEICMCGFMDAWEHFFELRCAKNAHPDMQVIANKIKEEFIKNKYL